MAAGLAYGSSAGHLTFMDAANFLGISIRSLRDRAIRTKIDIYSSVNYIRECYFEFWSALAESNKELICQLLAYFQSIQKHDVGGGADF